MSSTNENDIDSLISLARNSQEKIELFVVDTEALSSLYDERFFEIDAEKCKKELLDAMSQLQLWFREDDCNLLSRDITGINDELIKLSKYFNFVCDYAERLASVIGVEKPETVEEIVDFAESIQVLADIYNTHPSSKWFDRNELFSIKQHFDHIESLHKELNGLRNSVLSLFDKEILEIDFPSDLFPVLQRFREDYKSSIGRLFNRDFYNDMKLLKLKSKDGNLSYKGALDVLNNLKYIWDLKTEIDVNSSQYRDDYGCLYTGLDTKWDLLKTNLDVFEKSIARLPFVTSAKLSKAIQEGQLASVIEKFTQLDSEFDLTSAFEKLESYLRSDITKTTPCNELIGKIETANALAEDYISKQQRLMDMRKANCSFGVLISDLETLDSINRLKDEISKQDATLSRVFKNYYNGKQTDWEKLVGALNLAGEFRNLKERYILSDAAVRYFSEDTNAREYCDNECKKLSNLLGDARKSVEWFISLFKDGQAFYDYDLWDLAKRMTLCREKKHQLEDWIDYGISRKKCFEAGLGEYIEKVEEFGLARRYVRDAYTKRFYRLWLDAVLPKFPAVQNFRGRAHAQNIADFRTLDKDQFQIAQSRIRERVISRIPDFNQLNNAKDEIAILRKELNKQRRLMPLRKLFTAIPNLLTTLRPCFMMSPLSVSVFLEAQSYEFDLVIFDEASQVQTEDAVGAIMRAKQVIIVGDTKQLPPTSFFLKANNDEYDIDTDEAKEENDAGAFESILEEAAAIMPEQSLRWHYRSRHEHLIAFSNIKIYNGRLMTFPSSTEKGPDMGVEYVYVKDGIYGGQSGRNSNMVEAQKVADLVFEHFEKHPDRSLGVVTFSEHQQDAIERVIHQRRLNNQRYDGFFNEDRSVPFFVKNLENVQGDERDTIIFSIGYAKNRVGKMSMNFGPLNKEGGFRRLNVAITRAKHNLKLVGSIQPADINLENVKSEGPKLLRSYIEFAQQGVKALDNEISSSSEGILESPFEESVYDFLVDKGYNVVTQVVCSSYRIDLAIKHPMDSGKYVIGIECDGATYHSSRTARERDRLRQTILEDMGWTIYRIWSTDWIKNQKTEEEKLVNAIECALNGVKVECDDCENPESDVLPIGDIEEKIESHKEEVCGTEYGFEFYERASINCEWGVKDNLSEIISKEYPIKLEELCKRIAPAFGRQKATSVVRNSVKEVMQKELMDDFIEDRNGFIWIANDTDMKVRVPNPDDPDSVRSIELICNEELALAMKTIAKKSIGITRDGLFAETKRVFGFKHTGSKINKSLNEVFSQMVDNNEIVELDEKIKIV